MLAQRRQKLNTRTNEITVSSLNRDYVIHVPGLLGKVLNYACKLPCKFIGFISYFIISSIADDYCLIIYFFFVILVVPRYPHPNSENEQWMTWIDRNISTSSHGFETVGGFLQGRSLSSFKKKKLFLNFFIQLSFLFNLLETNGNKYYK